MALLDMDIVEIATEILHSQLKENEGSVNKV